MDSKSTFSAVFLLTVVTSAATLAASVGGMCPAGEFLNKDTKSCMTCSKCPLNKIVRRPCSDNTDTLCGPFYEFEFFNQDNKETDPDQNDFNLFVVQSTKKPTLAVRSGVPGGEQEINNDSPVSVTGPCLKDNTIKWREFSYSLICALALLSLLFVCYVIVTQVQMRRLHASYKLASSQQEVKEEPIYCYTHMFTATEEQEHHSKLPHLPHHVPHLPHTIYKPVHLDQRVYSQQQQQKTHHHSPNHYVTTVEQPPEVNQHLLPILADDSSVHTDHVQVIYSSKK